MLTWAERLQLDPELRAFVDAEITRAGIELDSLKWQRDHGRACLVTLTAQLNTARAELRTLRRQRA
jgi:hypothetical protein